MDYADYRHLTFEPRPNGVLLVTINRPEVLNATDARLHWELDPGVAHDRRRSGGARRRWSPAPARRSRRAATSSCVEEHGGQSRRR